MRRRAVAADAAHGDIDRIHIGQSPTRGKADHARRQVGAGVKRQIIIGPGEALEKPVLKHRPGAAAAFLGRLADHHQSPRPLILHRRQAPRGANQDGHMDVVTAGVHDRNLKPVVVEGRGDARIVEPGQFLDRQGVHIDPYEYRRSGPILEHADNPEAAHLFGHFETKTPEFSCQTGRAFLLVIGKLRVLVQLDVKIVQIGEIGRHSVFKRLVRMDRLQDHGRRHEGWSEQVLVAHLELR